MKHLLFKELDKDGKEIRKVSITQELADELNAKAKKNKDLPTYELAKKTKK